MIILFFLGLGLICFIISIILESIGFDEETSLDIGRYIVIAILLLFVGGSFLKAVYEEVTTPESNSYTSSSYSSSDSPDYDVEAPSGGGYHYTSGYTRSDGTEVQGYISGNPDGVRENNIEYMRDNGDSEGLRDAYSSAR